MSGSFKNYKNLKKSVKTYEELHDFSNKDLNLEFNSLKDSKEGIVQRNSKKNKHRSATTILPPKEHKDSAKRSLEKLKWKAQHDEYPEIQENDDLEILDPCQDFIAILASTLAKLDF
jgi:hypothetical protein